MPASVINGKNIAREILNSVKIELNSLNFKPVFCDVLVGDDPVSESYVKIKKQTAESLGIEFKLVKYLKNITTEALLEEIGKLNLVPNISGLIIQLPLPPALPRQEILDAIDPQIDADCVSSLNSKNFYSGLPSVLPPTAAAIMRILETLPITAKSLKFLVIGQGELVGRPVTFFLKQKGYEVHTADISTQNLTELIAQADVIISATGKAGLVRGENIKPGAVVIDAGSSEQNGSISGDVDFASALPKAAYISPVPGGVGPITVAMLLKNVVATAKKISAVTAK